MSMAAASGAHRATPDSRAAEDLPRVTYISWAESCSRSDNTARELGGPSHMVYLPEYGSRATTILFKYLGASGE